MSNIVSDEKFVQIFQDKLGQDYERALTIFRACGENISFNVTKVLLRAVDQGKVNEVLEELENHYSEHLQFQHPDIRGMVEDRLLRVNKTQIMFSRICNEILCLQST